MKRILLSTMFGICFSAHASTSVVTITDMQCDGGYHAKITESGDIKNGKFNTLLKLYNSSDNLIIDINANECLLGSVQLNDRNQTIVESTFQPGNDGQYYNIVYSQQLSGDMGFDGSIRSSRDGIVHQCKVTQMNSTN
ncbi:hypothetical protein NEC53_001071 [Salmonella enterica]|nr:hypothetical protein [Salmonella enterica]